MYFGFEKVVTVFSIIKCSLAKGRATFIKENLIRILSKLCVERADKVGAVVRSLLSDHKVPMLP